MDFNAMAYPDVILLGSNEYKAKRNIADSTLLIPYTDEIDVGIGDVILQKMGGREVSLKVLDASFSQGGTLGIGTAHPDLVKLKVLNLTADEHKSKEVNSVINIGNLHGEQVQVGNHNSQTVTISLQHLVEAVAKSKDEEAKGILRKLFENSTVASVVGAGLSGLIGLV
ncbi:hypothetical protein HRJ41_17160 [Pseudomonas sp. BF61]|uniref:hypothetical protein n=1 Tax=Pseudomonas sp. BF61 TaxID=2741068 RepID=UPI001C0E4DD8|nr:hypothetical protein [Pseudomonas sp. BF61]MBU4629210.1 hypothetical protein [Pseudomonas sp. BF61]